MDHQKIGCFIAALRREKGWTQRELATRLGVTDKAVSRWETGKGLPDISLLRPLSEALGVSVNELLSGEAIKPGQELAKSDALVLHTLEAAESASVAFGGICFMRWARCCWRAPCFF